jgi:hypothetical protein
MTNIEQYEFKYENGQLLAINHEKRKDVEFAVGGVTYTVGWTDPFDIIQIIPKENIRILLEYLQEQYGLVKGRYDESVKGIEETKGVDEKFLPIIQGVWDQLRSMTDKKQMDHFLKKAPAYGEFTDKILKRIRYEQTVKDLEPTVALLKKQIDLVVSILDKVAKDE